MKTRKYEEVYREEYRDVVEAYALIGRFLNRYTTKSGCIQRWFIGRQWSSRVD
jgi:hypothetical protein